MSMKHETMVLYTLFNPYPCLLQHLLLLLLLLSLLLRNVYLAYAELCGWHNIIMDYGQVFWCERI
jgi:hypothetical protein